MCEYILWAIKPSWIHLHLSLHYPVLYYLDYSYLPSGVTSILKVANGTCKWCIKPFRVWVHHVLYSNCQSLFSIATGDEWTVYRHEKTSHYSKTTKLVGILVSRISIMNYSLQPALSITFNTPAQLSPFESTHEYLRPSQRPTPTVHASPPLEHSPNSEEYPSSRYPHSYFPTISLVLNSSPMQWGRWLYPMLMISYRWWKA